MRISWISGVFGEAPYVRRAHMVILCRIGRVSYIRLLSLTVGGKVVQLPRATRTSMPRTIVIPLSTADVYRLNLYLRIRVNYIIAVLKTVCARPIHHHRKKFNVRRGISPARR